MWQWHCRNGGEKNLWQLICGNGIVEIEGKKKLWQWNCRNRRKKNNLWYQKLEESISQSPHLFLWFLFSKVLGIYSLIIPNKHNLLISRLKSMLEILFCLFISPLHNKRQVPSLKDYISSQSYIPWLFSYSSTLLQCAQLRIVSFGLM